MTAVGHGPCPVLRMRENPFEPIGNGADVVGLFRIGPAICGHLVAQARVCKQAFRGIQESIGPIRLGDNAGTLATEDLSCKVVGWGGKENGASRTEIRLHLGGDQQDPRFRFDDR